MCPWVRWFSVLQHRVAGGVLALCLLIVLNGCAEQAKQPNPGEQATVSGTVKNDGKPISVDSNVVFYCDAASATAAGKIDALGNFSLTAADKAVGIPAGRYKVMVRPPEEAPVQATDSDAYKQMMLKGGAATEKPQPKDSDIPGKFQTFESSGLVLEVKAGPNTFDIDLAKLAK